MALQKPTVVAALDKGPDHCSGLLQGLKVAQIGTPILECPDEALRDAGVLRLAHPRRAWNGCRAILSRPGTALPGTARPIRDADRGSLSPINTSAVGKYLQIPSGTTYVGCLGESFESAT